jgi:hypothetical protein
MHTLSLVSRTDGVSGCSQLKSPSRCYLPVINHLSCLTHVERVHDSIAAHDRVLEN